MNSRDAAYDEEEQLRRAIEESKDDNKTSPEENVNRRGKRSRSDSEAYVLPPKSLRSTLRFLRVSVKHILEGMSLTIVTF